MENTRRIQVVSRTCRYICTVFVFLIPVISAFYWAYFNELYSNIGSLSSLPVLPNQNLSLMTRFLAFIVELLENIVIIYGIMKFRRLFSLYEKGMIFSKDNVACFRGLGWAFIVWVGADIVSRSLMNVVLTFSNPPGQRFVIVSIWNGDLAALFVGIAVLVVSWVMDEGRKIAEEQEQFI